MFTTSRLNDYTPRSNDTYWLYVTNPNNEMLLIPFGQPKLKSWRFEDAQIDLYLVNGIIHAEILRGESRVVIPAYDIVGLPKEIHNQALPLAFFLSDSWIHLSALSDDSYKLHVHSRLRGGGWRWWALGGLILVAAGGGIFLSAGYAATTVFGVTVTAEQAAGALVAGGVGCGVAVTKYVSDAANEQARKDYKADKDKALAAQAKVHTNVLEGKNAEIKLALNANGGLEEKIARREEVIDELRSKLRSAQNVVPPSQEVPDVKSSSAENIPSSSAPQAGSAGAAPSSHGMFSANNKTPVFHTDAKDDLPKRPSPSF